jgi:hypothetical protein
MEADEGPVAAPEVDLRQEGASRPIGPRKHRFPRPRHSARVTCGIQKVHQAAIGVAE